MADIQRPQPQSWKDTGMLQYLQGNPTKDIKERYNKSHKTMTLEQKHAFRADILKKFNKYQALPATLNYRFNHQPKTLKHPNEALLLRPCKDYHWFSIEQVAQQISAHGKVVCSPCQVQCTDASEIFPDALLMSYFQKVQYYEGSYLVFKRTRYGSDEHNIIKVRRQAQESKHLTLIEQLSNYCLIEIMVYQWAENVNSLKSQLQVKLEQAILNGFHSNYEEHYIKGSGSSLMTNLLCFATNTKIRNPLIHKDCIPTEHANRIILFSFEHVYDMISSGRDVKVKCIFPNCNNYFDKQNFQRNAIVVQSLRQSIYQESQESHYGMITNGLYQKQWHLNYAESSLQRDDKNRDYIVRYIQTVKKLISQVSNNMNLKDSKKRTRNAQKSQILNFQREGTAKKSQTTVFVQVGPYTLTPVRCIKCTSLKACDIYQLGINFKRMPGKVCPLCRFDHKQSSDFHDIFYIDLKLMKFIFLNGQASEIMFDTVDKTYLHKLSYFNANTLAQHLKEIGNLDTTKVHAYDMNLTHLDSSKHFVPVIDTRCKTKSYQNNPDFNINDHYIFIQTRSRITDQLSCPVCGINTRSDKLWYNQELQRLMKINNNKLIWNGKEGAMIVQQVRNIASIRYYEDITSQKDLDLQRTTIFYWRNYQGNAIKYPIRFKGCQHQIQTTICDFQDVIFQARKEGKKKFKCRWTACSKQYQSIDDIQRVTLDLYRKLNEQGKISEMVTSNQYWLEYSPSGGKVKILKHFIENATKQQNKLEVQKYRNRFTQPDYQEFEDLKQGQKELERIQKAIEDQQPKVERDRSHYRRNQELEYSKDEDDWKVKLQSFTQLKIRKLKVENYIKRKKQEQLQRKRMLNSNMYLNFNQLGKMFPLDMRKMDKAVEQAKIYDTTQVQFNQIMTHGNLLEFKHPLNMFKPNQQYHITIDELYNQIVAKGSQSK